MTSSHSSLFTCACNPDTYTYVHMRVRVRAMATPRRRTDVQESSLPRTQRLFSFLRSSTSTGGTNGPSSERPSVWRAEPPRLPPRRQRLPRYIIPEAPTSTGGTNGPSSERPSVWRAELPRLPPRRQRLPGLPEARTPAGSGARAGRLSLERQNQPAERQGQATPDPYFDPNDDPYVDRYGDPYLDPWDLTGAPRQRRGLFPPVATVRTRVIRRPLRYRQVVSVPQQLEDIAGGYDCEFVEKPPKQIQCECPICMLVLREPSQLECCGSVFCTSCIERALQTKSACPLCKKVRPTCFLDKRLKQSLSEFHVYCCHRVKEGGGEGEGGEEGCEWVGEFGELGRHLNENPSTDNQLKGCLFVETKCKFCKKPFQRMRIQDHQTDVCPMRESTCSLCDHKGTHVEITGTHVEVCPHVPVQCSLCHGNFKRSCVRNHQSNECPQREYACPHCSYSSTYEVVTERHLRYCRLAEEDSGMAPSHTHTHTHTHTHARAHTHTYVRTRTHIFARVTCN